MSTLFNLTAELKHLESIVVAMEEGTDLPAEIADWLDVTQADFDKKVEGYCSVIGELDALAKARGEEAARIKSLAAITNSQIERMKVALKEAMQKLETPKLETTRYKVWVQNAGGKQPIQIEEEDVPHDLKKVQFVTDKDKIREALESGKILPFARLLPRGQVLRIK
jgi:hypothetical protein